MEWLTVYIKKEAFILIPALYFLGLILEQTQKIPKWTHAWIKLIIAEFCCLVYFGLDIRAFVQGIMVTGAEMIFKDLIHNTIANFYEKRKDQQK